MSILVQYITLGVSPKGLDRSGTEKKLRRAREAQAIAERESRHTRL